MGGGAFPSTYEAHWDEFLWWFYCSIASCVGIWALSRVLLPLLLPSAWAAMVEESPWKAISVPKNVVEWWPAAIVAPLALDSVRVLTNAALAESAMALYLPAPVGMWRATGAAVG